MGVSCSLVICIHNSFVFLRKSLRQLNNSELHEITSSLPYTRYMFTAAPQTLWRPQQRKLTASHYDHFCGDIEVDSLLRAVNERLVPSANEQKHFKNSHSYSYYNSSLPSIMLLLTLHLQGGVACASSFYRDSLIFCRLLHPSASQQVVSPFT